ncbi:hypothetical protein F1C16_03030 [Hymenobacter sp. NBH84]|uniref:hypothetical protein n=1 Tax=Hymenobacter sp. NBH84 TaxID=2596915 RepID=UPI001629092E|nr:hypothetical protein [Hymenobacter sp. NBH84]QNE38597.1 hypothetical protein F1C16_03030 [Hymenobacter sp. NBH84]
MDPNTLTIDQLMQLTADQLRRVILACGLRINAIRLVISQDQALDTVLSEDWRSIAAVRKTLYARLYDLEADTMYLAHAA